MHAENLSACACILASIAGLGGRPPFGVNFAHAFIAFWKAGESGLRPVTVIVPFAEGSGKFGTPFFRMHDANFVESLPPSILSVAWPPLPPPDEVPPPPDEGGAEEEVVVFDPPDPATLGVFPFPPHAAAVRARTSAAAATLSALIRVMRSGIASTA
jgi:hypothetical protein